MPPFQVSPYAGVTITNPLVLYRALLATKQIEPDPAQHRLAIHLQKLYYRLKDYSPQSEYRSQLKAISQALEDNNQNEDEGFTVAAPGHPLRRNPLFAHLFPKKERSDILSLAKVLTNDEDAINLNSPRGLLLHGEVGSGKSMLLDILVDSLPNPKKKRWHFNTFMLESISRLESLRQLRQGTGKLEAEYSLLWLAKDMIEKSPILFLDEFQLPDRAASKILSNLLTSFFQLGGVLIASSNRMPDELAKATGVKYVPPPTGGLVRNWLGLGAGSRGRRITDSGNAEFASFLEVLKARCEVWDMEGVRDWRRREIEHVGPQQDRESRREPAMGTFDKPRQRLSETLESFDDHLTPLVSSTTQGEGDLQENLKPSHIITPKNYLLSTADNEDTWVNTVRAALPHGTAEPIHWESGYLSIYGRTVLIPRQHAGVALWTFEELCGRFFGPADYITIASTFHTLIVDNIPVLTLLQKNEARRLITLLDALYEARCKLIIRAEAGPDDLFFPETKAIKSVAQSVATYGNETDRDSTYPETFSEIYQDQTSPFRPNVSSYAEETKRGYDPVEDSDFGLVPGQGNEIGRQVDFGMTSAFIGDDERFAYKRASSRLWEMCGTRWHARLEPGWWKPLPLEIRQWERPSSTSELTLKYSKGLLNNSFKGDVHLGPSIELDKPAGLQGRQSETREEAPSKDADTQGPKAGDSASRNWR